MIMQPLAITMGCPGGIGPELILKHFTQSTPRERPPSVVVGDSNVINFYGRALSLDFQVQPWKPGAPLPREKGIIPLYESSRISPSAIEPGTFNETTAMAMAKAITTAVKGIQKGHFSGLCTCPISKEALQMSGHRYPGHTELLAALSSSNRQVMMLAGNSLRVTLATIHCPLNQVSSLLDQESLLLLYRTSNRSLHQDFNIDHPRLAVAALNPHGGEGGMFGKEEQDIIVPSITRAQGEGIDIQGPFPPDTVFIQAARGDYDAVVCMYHDQGLIPFKLLHFKDGVNVTLGLPLVRTSVDHGTAYDIAGKGRADPTSLAAAVSLAESIIHNRSHQKTL